MAPVQALCWLVAMLPVLLPLILFAIATSITPGPNNVMVAASAANHGLRATLPLVFGISIGFALMLVLVGLGVAGTFKAVPMLAPVMRWIAVGWLLLLAWKMARAAAPGSAAGAGVRMGFVGAALFQWINPKAWVIALAASGAFIVPGRGMAPQLAAIGLVFLVVCIPCVLCWAALGSAAGRLLHSPARLRAFNLTMAVLLVVSMIPVALGE